MKKVQIVECDGCYRIFTGINNGYYSKMNKMNNLIPINYNTYTEAEEECKKNGYEIVKTEKEVRANLK